MKILFITDWFPPYSTGSAEQIVFNLFNGFRQRGYNTLVVSTVQDKNKVEDGKNGIYRIYVPNYHPRWRPYLSLYNPWVVGKIKKIIKEVKPDVIHAHILHCYTSYHCLKLAKKYCPKVFLTVHDVNLFHYDKFDSYIDRNNLSVQKDFDYHVSWLQELKDSKSKFNPLRRPIIKYYLKYVNKIFAVSGALQKALLTNGIKNTEVVYNGIDIKKFSISEKEKNIFKIKYNILGKKVVLFGGRLSKQKGGEELISAMSLVIKKIPKVVLLIVASTGGNWGTMNKLISMLQLRDNIILTGWLSPKEMILAYNSANVCVTPSLCLDTFNLMNIEAMAAKKPVIGTCFGGTSEIVVNKETGYIVNPLDIKTLADKIVDLLNNKDKSIKFGEAGYNRVNNFFSIDKFIDKTLEFYNN